jgi:ethanolamine ammonia-lyase small subunit
VIDAALIEQIANAVLAEIRSGEGVSSVPCERPRSDDTETLEDITGEECRRRILIEEACDAHALTRMKTRTNARIGVGRAGPRYKTRTLLTLRADHAAARDAVFMDVDQGILDDMGLFAVESRCADKNEFLTRPDLGRKLSESAVHDIRARCGANPDVQIFAADGLSSTAISANLPDLLPCLTDGLKDKGVAVGTPFFVRNGRVGIMDCVSELLGAKVTCVLLGERPGLATAESMSAYIAYNARVGMPESERTVVSNIHRGGTPPVEAGAYLAEALRKILKAKASGVNLRKEWEA